MKNKGLRIFLATLFSALFIATFATLCYFAYKLNWNKHAFWWPWLGALFIVDFIAAWLIFHNKNKSDANKSFWLFIVMVATFVGFIFYLCLGTKNNAKNGTHPNNAILLENIFQAKESITICAKTFFAPYDVFDALNFMATSNKKVTIVVSKQSRKVKQQLLHQLFEKRLSRSISIYFLDQDVVENFMIIDGQKVVIPAINFNYKNVYSDKPIAEIKDGEEYNHKADLYIKQATFDICEYVKRPPYKRLFFAFLNIFYIIF